MISLIQTRYGSRSPSQGRSPRPWLRCQLNSRRANSPSFARGASEGKPAFRSDLDTQVWRRRLAVRVGAQWLGRRSRAPGMRRHDRLRDLLQFVQMRLHVLQRIFQLPDAPIERFLRVAYAHHGIGPLLQLLALRSEEHTSE